MRTANSVNMQRSTGPAQPTRKFKQTVITLAHQLCFVRLGLCAAMMLSCISAQGQGVTIWDGSVTTFTEASGADGSQPADQDRLTPAVWITRNVTQGLFNAATESGYTHFVSPADTAWAYGSLNNYASLTYTSWEGLFGGRSGGGPRSTLGNPAVLHLVSDNIYLSVTFLSWGGSLGGFSYERSTPSVPEPSIGTLALSATMAAGIIRHFGRRRRPGRLRGN